MGNKAALVEPDKVTTGRDAAAILASMWEDENLYWLGAILVVDMFNNNTDHFEVMPNERGMTNNGNVFFVRKGGGDRLRIKGSTRSIIRRAVRGSRPWSHRPPTRRTRGGGPAS